MCCLYQKRVSRLGSTWIEERLSVSGFSFLERLHKHVQPLSPCMLNALTFFGKPWLMNQTPAWKR